MVSSPAPPVAISFPSPRLISSSPSDPLTVSSAIEVVIVSDKAPPIKIPVPLIVRNASVSALKSKLTF